MKWNIVIVQTTGVLCAKRGPPCGSTFLSNSMQGNLRLILKFAVRFRAALIWVLRPHEEVSIKLHALNSKQIFLVGVSSFPILLVKAQIKFEYT